MAKVRLCSICGKPLAEVNFAIRDFCPKETGPEWLWRHIVGALTIGLKRRKYAVIIPVCPECVEVRRTANIAGEEETA